MPVNPLGCADPYAPIFYLGKQNALVAFKMPDANYSRTLNDGLASHDLLEGRAVDRAPYGQRVWGLNYTWLYPDVTSMLYEFATRQRGIGPFVFIDPHVKNLLSPNQASGTDSLVTAEGFSVSGTGEALSSTNVRSVQGERSLLWTFASPVSGVGGRMDVVAPSGLGGWILPNLLPVAFSGQVIAVNDPAITVFPRLTFMNGAGGTVISAVTGTAINAVTGSWTTFCVTGIVPTGSKLVPNFFVTANTVTNGAGLGFDKMQLEQGNTCTTWEYGDGQPIVAVRVSSETVERIRRATLTFELIEVTP